MKLIPGAKIETLTQQTLDSLWAEAESLGRIEIDKRFGRDAYQVQIKFERKSGTTIWAKGCNSSIHLALSDAINEAREMGAG